MLKENSGLQAFSQMESWERSFSGLQRSWGVQRFPLNQTWARRRVTTDRSNTPSLSSLPHRGFCQVQTGLASGLSRQGREEGPDPRQECTHDALTPSCAHTNTHTHTCVCGAENRAVWILLTFASHPNSITPGDKIPTQIVKNEVQ